MQRTLFTEDHHAFRESIRGFLAKEVVPYYAQWERDGMVPRDLYRKLGDIGYFGIAVPEQYGGAGISSYKYQAVVAEEVSRVGVSLGAAGAHLLLGLPYLLEFGTDEQRRRWMPGFMSGDIMTALAMTEPGAGSDLAGIRTNATLSADGSHYVVNGAKTFISGGAQADLIIVVCRTSPAAADDRRAGLSLLCVDTKSEGFEVGRTLDKIGMRTSDTAELSFTDVTVPAENLLGEEGMAFSYLTHNLVQERLGCGYTSFAQAAAAIAFTTHYVQERKVFGKLLSSFQNTKFVLAECAAEVEAAQAMVDKAVELFDAHALGAADAAKVKLFCTEVAGRVIDKCLQLHGGYGYILEYPIARLYTDTRVSRIFAGSNEVMKTIIAKDMYL
ncbi:alkylation response protein AidB-like acyl-CoA dehydrogenase [Rhodococcus wratislaviensis]|uniref:Acyl-[acyl-carrier-protein] dehydrogenase MbtN n=2 Tax=Rhodococcus wratislaviensis TaxID=44752 RepID=A0AB38F5V5_RHOWR|nr:MULTISPECIES: acyl-CoA dehydrogenase family protein [Rhodococcus]REE70724.1 alkylation response protein AidB-like acyl-CoA dehydrogenase [Rhodococcus wratislaviensis]WAM14798.1 acyl-CoA dehydrogenase family protein [Rhodococcus sp. JS3073]GAF45300.1 acyl-CoA dehydrogenase [Rhodococcus wratislaviensis NBRC 100605]SPZ34912.1 acyl-CoA dehydrogenase [Rhodococcus wratislaviensis]